MLHAYENFSFYINFINTFIIDWFNVDNETKRVIAFFH